MDAGQQQLDADQLDEPIGDRQRQGAPLVGRVDGMFEWLQRHDRPVLVGLAALVVLPLAVAAVAVRSPRWYPIGDTAMTELRVRDVGTRNTPLIGLPGRIGSGAVQGSHPGPLSFYVLAVPYRLLGSSAWALQVATAVFHALAIGLGVLVAYRRGGLRVGLLVALAFAGLVYSYGFALLTSPWNPLLPVLWWVVVLLAVWSVACGDVVMLPVAVAAGSLCAQTHVPYLGMALGFGVFVVVLVALVYRATPAGSAERRRIRQWALGSLGLAMLLWVPPVIDELDNSPGNLATLWKHFTHPTEPPLGLSEAIRTVVRHLDPLWFFRHEVGLGAGIAFLVVWAGSVFAAWRLKSVLWLRLHLVVGVALVLAIYSVSRIFGVNWYYLSLWVWGIMAMASVAVAGTAWTAWTQLAKRSSLQIVDVVDRAMPMILAASLTVAVVVAGSDARRVVPPEEAVWSQLGRLAGPTAAALESGRGAAAGSDGRYIVSWNDPLRFGSQGFGLLDELERRGFDVGVEGAFETPAARHRVMNTQEATAIVHLAIGGNVAVARAIPGGVEVASADSRTVGERAEFLVLRAEVVAQLEESQLTDLVPLVDSNLFKVAIDDRLPLPARPKVARMLELGQEAAVFILPNDAVR